MLHEEELKSEVKELRKTLEVTEAKSARKYEALHLEYSLLKVIPFTFEYCHDYLGNHCYENSSCLFVFVDSLW